MESVLALRCEERARLVSLSARAPPARHRLCNVTCDVTGVLRTGLARGPLGCFGWRERSGTIVLSIYLHQKKKTSFSVFSVFTTRYFSVFPVFRNTFLSLHLPGSPRGFKQKDGEKMKTFVRSESESVEC